MMKNSTSLLASLTMFLGFQASHLQAEILVKEGDKIAFLGDSITAGGFSNAGGYVKLVGAGLAANGVKVELIGAGISGHKSNQMLERLNRDVISKKPQWMTLSCGVNDVWHGKNGVPLEDYEKNITAIVEQTQKAGIQVVILTSTMIGEDASNPNNIILKDYNQFLIELAKEKKCQIADLNADMQIAVAAARQKSALPAKGNTLTTDGVHMAYSGNAMMASGVLKALGLNANEIAKAKAAWLDLPNTNQIGFNTALTQRQAESLEKRAAEKKMTVKELVNDEFNKLINSLVK